MASAGGDSVPLAGPPEKPAPALSLDLLLVMFLAFVSVNSSPFIDHVLYGFRGAVQGRNPTSQGVVVQGVLFVLAVCAVEFLRKRVL